MFMISLVRAAAEANPSPLDWRLLSGQWLLGYLIRGGEHISLLALPTHCVYWPINHKFYSPKLWNPFCRGLVCSKRHPNELTRRGKVAKQGRTIQYGQHILLYHPLRITALKTKGGARNSMETTSEFIVILYCKLQKKVGVCVSL